MAVVAIGRNEAGRLRLSLQSVLDAGIPVVYVDSGSEDGSPSLARSLGVEVVELNRERPFSAARARNAGLARALQLDPGLAAVQFVDADCEVEPGWLPRARQALAADPRLGVVFGARRELHPDRSPYNLVCDLDWKVPPGEALSCGGDAMIRVEAIQQAGGYDPLLIAGEEADLCIRLRRHQWKILSVDAPMTRHDAGILRFRQWWQRSRRTGFAFASGSARHGRGPERLWRKETRSACGWAILPAVAALLALPTAQRSWWLLALFPLQFFRIARGKHAAAVPWRASAVYAFFCLLGKFPQALGALRFWVSRSGAPTTLIEYKGDALP